MSEEEFQDHGQGGLRKSVFRTTDKGLDVKLNTQYSKNTHCFVFVFISEQSPKIHMVCGHVQNTVVRVQAQNRWSTHVLDTQNKLPCLLELVFCLCSMLFTWTVHCCCTYCSGEEIPVGEMGEATFRFHKLKHKILHIIPSIMANLSNSNDILLL